MELSSSKECICNISKTMHLLTVLSREGVKGFENFSSYAFTKDGVVYATNGIVFCGIKYNKLNLIGNDTVEDNKAYHYIYQSYGNGCYGCSLDKAKTPEIPNLDNFLNFNPDDFIDIDSNKYTEWTSLNLNEYSLHVSKTCINDFTKERYSLKMKKDGSQIRVENDYAILIFFKKNVFPIVR